MSSAAYVDLGAISHNAGTVLAGLGSAALMGVVKADGYGHGLVQAAQAAQAGGATWLGVAQTGEALALRSAGVTGPLVAWLLRQDDLTACVVAGVDLGVSSLAVLGRAVAAAAATGRTARVHLKVDTGLSRGGCTLAELPALVEAADKAQVDGTVDVVGVMSHLAASEEGPSHPIGLAQKAAFTEALSVTEPLNVQVRHLANSAAALTDPSSHYDLVRVGAALYGLHPVAGDFGLRPAMTLVSEVALVKRVPAGSGVGYGHRYVTASETTLALIPLGYGDGVPRNGTNVGPVQIGERRYRVAGSVAMDQLTVDVGDDPVQEGDRVVLFGQGGPSAQEWGEVTGTIDYEMVTRISGRVPRVYT